MLYSMSLKKTKVKGKGDKIVRKLHKKYNWVTIDHTCMVTYTCGRIYPPYLQVGNPLTAGIYLGVPGTSPDGTLTPCIERGFCGGAPRCAGPLARPLHSTGDTPPYKIHASAILHNKKDWHMPCNMHTLCQHVWHAGCTMHGWYRACMCMRWVRVWHNAPLTPVHSVAPSVTDGF